MSDSIKKKIISGSFWAVIGQVITLFFTLIANIWLARLLTPHEFGQLGIIMVFISISNVLTEGGMSGALIRKPDATKEDYSTIFLFNLLISVFCFILIIIFSTPISNYYSDLSLRIPLIVTGVVLLINALQISQNAKLISDMRYKRKSLYETISVILSSIIAIFFAYKGYGLWSLIIMQLSKSSFTTIQLWLFNGYYFNLKFSSKSFKELYSFGINTTLASVLTIFFDNIYQLILGKIFSFNQVGFYYQAKKLNDVPTGVFASLTQGPIFSGLAKIQENKEDFLKVYNNIISVLLSILGFVTLLLFYYSDIIVNILLGEKWANSGIYLKYLSIASFFYIQELFNRIIFKVYNETKRVLYLDVIKKIIQTISIIIGIYLKNINILLIGFIASNAIGYSINYIVSRKILNSFNNKEFLLTFKVFFIGLLIVSLMFFSEKVFLVSGNKTLFFIFLIIPLYLLALKILNIFDIGLLKNNINSK